MAATLDARVHAIRQEAEGIVSVEFRPAAKRETFPSFEAGSHIDLHLPNGLVRSYSLCNAPTDRHRYVVGVLNDRSSRGGSRYVHEQLRVGSIVPISAPRNHFRLHEDAPLSVLVAGGIGITPIYAMLRRLHALGKPFQLIYCARSRQEAAFTEEILELAGDRVRWHVDAEQGGPPDLQALLAASGPAAYYYCCGPGPMLDAFVRACSALGYPNSHLERFAAAVAPAPPSEPPGACTVELRRSGRTLQVPADVSILKAVLQAGVEVDFSCEEGVCGTCETPVISGEVDHRDCILSETEKAANKTMMICVSRCRKPGPLVLDL